MTPKINWSKTVGDPKGCGGPDFRFIPVAPYFLSLKNVCEPGNSEILELPMTILYTGIIKNENNIFSKFYLNLPDSLLKKVVNKIFLRQKWLRIFHNSKVEDWHKLYLAAKKNELSLMQFMIHSAELMPGGSPYSKNERDVEKIYLQIEKMFKIFKEHNLESINILDLYNKYIKNNL
jgi:hypothetical protein